MNTNLCERYRWVKCVHFIFNNLQSRVEIRSVSERLSSSRLIAGCLHNASNLSTTNLPFCGFQLQLRCELLAVFDTFAAVTVGSTRGFSQLFMG